MRAMTRCWRLVGAAILGGALLGGCWADFPDDRFNQQQDAKVQPDTADKDVYIWPDQGELKDKGPDAPVTDKGPTPDKQVGDQQLVDQQVPDQTVPPPDGAVCTPNAFIKCVTTTMLEKCNNKGTATMTVDCSPYLCNAAAGRCNNCTIGAAPTCKGNTLVTCSAAGLEQTTPCQLGCQNGACCLNADKDAYTDCQGDCNDNDAKVFPGQTAWQTTASSGSFDYNCDKKEERQYPSQVNCQFVTGSCVGTGWAGTVPKCGAQGQLTTCKKQGSKCIEDTTTTATQGCR
jgi:hypothetical protein